MTDFVPDDLRGRLAETERAATSDRRPQRADWLLLALLAVAVPIVILLAGWGAR